MTKKKDYCEECNSRIPTAFIVLWTIGITILICMLILARLLPTDDERVIDVKLMGERLCESKGLEYKNFSITDEEIPRILCVQKSTLPTPIMDRIVYMEKTKND